MPRTWRTFYLNIEVASARQSVLTLTNESAMPPFIQLRGWLRETEIGTSISEAPSLFFIFIPGDGTREGEELLLG